MAYDPNTFNISPYYDDFSPDKGFLRVLFKPGYAVQARELTQLQTILQDQLSKLGDHLFKDGSRIVGGGISVRNTEFLMVNVGSGSPFADMTDFSSLLGGVLTSVGSSNTKAKVVHYINPDFSLDGKLILVVDFISGEEFSDQTFNLTTVDGTVYSAATIPNETYPTTGMCKLVTVDEGIFYINGFFVRTSTQQFTPYSSESGYRSFEFGQNFQALTKKIGFDTRTSDAVTEKDDSTLRDPAIGSYNYNAPGADRYKIILTLSQVGIDETPDDFVELLRFEGGKITKKVDRIAFGEIQKALALRTYDESGSYTVRPFDITVKPNTTSNVLLSIGEGKAYVLGYDVENQFPQSVVLPKGRDIQNRNSISFPYSVGNYIGVSMGISASNFGVSFANALHKIGNGSASFKARGTVNGVSGVLLSTGYVHGALPKVPNGRTGSAYRLYMYGVSGDISKARYLHIYDNTNGETLGFARPLIREGAVSGSDMMFGSTYTDGGLVKTGQSSLVYELKPGYAIGEISSLYMIGKLVSDKFSPEYVNDREGVTYSVNINSNFTQFSSSIPGGALKMLGHPVSVGSDSVEDISKYYIVSGENVACSPDSARIFGSSDYSSVRLVVTDHQLLAGLTSGQVRMICPVVYTPNMSDQNTYRTKTAITGYNDSFTSTVFSTDENGRKYFPLSKIDAYSVQSVLESGTGVDYTEDFELDDGQRESHYQNARLYIKRSSSSLNRYTSTGTPISLIVTYSYFQHGGFLAAPFIGSSSYFSASGDRFPYEQIPLFTNSRTGKTVSLANCLDFRKSGLTSDTGMLKPYGMHEFGLFGNTIVSYTHYLPRIDKLCVKSDTDDGSAMFFIVSGEPNLSPVAPPDPQDALVVATITVPAYTHNPNDIVITPVDTKRFTMADIGKINKRVDEVEVFAKLSLSESEIESRSLRQSANQVEPLKTSIFSDEFYGHSISDVTDSTNVCSIDFERGELRPFFTTNSVSLQNGITTDVVVSSDGIATLKYSSLQYIQNTQYTKTIKVNPSNTVNWLGFMKLSKIVDPYYDTAYRPIVKTNALMENDNWTSSNANNSRGFGTQWNEWESLWTGIEQVEEEQDDIQKRILELPHSALPSAVPSVVSGNNRIGVSRTVASIDQKNSNYISARQLKNRIRHRIGSRVVDRSVVPYMPSNSVVASITGLKPNSTNLSLYFDGEVVKTGITTDLNGSCFVSFGISAGTYLAGNKVVRISDSDVTANSSIAAETFYYCSGLIDQRSSGCYSVLPPDLRRQTAASETVSKDPFNREIDSVESSNWSDPVSQTFFVDKKTYPEGIFLNSVTLYFYEKDSSLPVTVQIRPTVSGYPSPSVVVPFSTVTKQPSEVNSNSVAPTGTEFRFSTPVYLQPGEHSICILTNSDKYELFAAESGINAVAVVANTDARSGRAGSNQLVGTLFTPQGIGTAVPNPTTDLMFTLNRCEFVRQGTISYSSVEGCDNTQILKFYTPEIIPSSCTLSRKVGNTSFLNNQSIYLNQLFTARPQIVYSFARGSNSAVSPMVYMSAMYGIGVKMYVAGSTPNSNSSRYVSRVVELPEESASTGIYVFADCNTPSDTSDRISAYVRYSVNGESDIFTKPWVPMTRKTPDFVSNSEIDFREVQFTHLLTTGTFKAYQVRLDIGSTPGIVPTYYSTPAVRNIRTVSTVDV